MSETAENKDITVSGRSAGGSSTVIRRRVALVCGCVVAAFAIAFGAGAAVKSTSAVRTTDSLTPPAVNQTPQLAGIAHVRVADAPKLRPAPKPKIAATSSSSASQTIASPQTGTSQVQTTSPVQTTPVQTTPVQTVTQVQPATPAPVTTQQGGL